MISEQDAFDKLKYDISYTKNGRKVYKNKDGKIHRDGGPAVIFQISAEKFLEDFIPVQDVEGEVTILAKWYQNGLLHREDGPAIINQGMYAYYLNVLALMLIHFFQDYENVTGNSE
jgi:hypothetical protein